MPFIPVPDTILAEMIYLQSGEVVENTLYFQKPGGWNVQAMTDFAGVLSEWWLTEIRPLQPGNMALTTIRITDLMTQFAPGIDYVTGLPLAGTDSGLALPNNVTATVTFLTGLRGRSYRGRNYWLGLTEQTVANNTVDPARVTAIVDAYEALASYIAPGDEFHVVVSRQEGNAPRAVGVTTPVTAYRMESTIDSQRRRLPGRGQ